MRFLKRSQGWLVWGTFFLAAVPVFSVTQADWLALLPPYFAIQRALSQDQGARFKELEGPLNRSLETQLKTNSNDEELKALKDFVGVFQKCQNLTEARNKFGQISQIFVNHLKAHPEQTKKIQLFFCPMYSQGYAFWIQPDKESLANPYWGKEMLTCGVKRPWKSSQGNHARSKE
jgi:hypothetical protein